MTTTLTRRRHRTSRRPRPAPTRPAAPKLDILLPGGFTLREGLAWLDKRADEVDQLLTEVQERARRERINRHVMRKIRFLAMIPEGERGARSLESPEEVEDLEVTIFERIMHVLRHAPPEDMTTRCYRLTNAADRRDHGAFGLRLGRRPVDLLGGRGAKSTREAPRSPVVLPCRQYGLAYHMAHG